jgi:serine/threonine-protein kinase
LTLLRARQAQDWDQGQPRPVEEYLAWAEGLTPDDVLVLVVGELLLRWQRGERPELAEYQRRFPHLAADLADQFELADALGDNRTPAGRFPPPASVPAVPGYEVLRELGRGGMGVVYKARQVSLGRVVALKVILSGGHAGEEERRRFLAEAEAVARVRHPGIVQVYDYGTHEGLPFFSLELCDGGSLADRLAGTPLAAAEAATLAEQLARAVQAAHDAGVVHRDLKPANVLLCRRPGGAEPKVTDFGLAKRVEGGPGLTRTGAVVGTPSYMAPEQARAEKDVGPLADVYALGAVLYECLTGRPPFRAATAYETLAQVVGQEPAAVRQLQAGVPADLETICHKCLQKDPARRYGSAEAMADDLRRFLEGRPIAARPTGRAERLWRWCRREPLVAGLLAAVFVALTAGAAVSTALAVRASTKAKEAEESAEWADRKAEEAEQARAKVAEQRGIAEEEKRRAQKAEADTLADYRASTDDAIEQLIGSRPTLGPQERTYLERTLKRWQEFAKRKGDDEHSVALRAEGHFRVASLWDKLSRRDEARREYETARELRQRLVGAFPSVPQYLRDLAATHNNLGNLLAGLGKRDEARKEYEAARDIKKKLADAFPSVPQHQLDLARTHGNLGILLMGLGQTDAARREHEQARKLLKKLADAFADVPQYRKDLAGTHANLGVLLVGLGKGAEARKEYEAARDLQKKLAESSPDVPGYLEQLARSQYNLGLLLAGLGKGAEARREYEAARDLQKKLADTFPSMPRYQRELAATHHNIGYLLAGLGKRDEARREYETARGLQKKLADAFPDVPQHLWDLGNTHNNLASLLADLGNRGEARREYETTCDLRKKLAETFPPVPRYQVDLGGSYCSFGSLLHNDGKPAESLRLFDLAIRTLTPVYQNDPRTPRARQFLRTSHENRALAYRQLKKHAEAVKDWDRAVELSPKSEQPPFRVSRANSRVLAGQVAEAVAEVEELTKQPQASAPAAPKWNAAQWYNFACVYAVASGKVADKKQEYADRAMALLRRAVQAGLKEAAHLARDTDLDPLRDRDDFKKLLADLQSRTAADKKP